MADIGHIAESVGLLTWNRAGSSSAAMAAVVEWGATPERIAGPVLNGGGLRSSSGFRVEDRRASGTAQFIDVDYIQAGWTFSSGLLGYERFQLNAYREIPEVRLGMLVDLYI